MQQAPLTFTQSNNISNKKSLHLPPPTPNYPKYFRGLIFFWEISWPKTLNTMNNWFYKIYLWKAKNYKQYRNLRRGANCLDRYCFMKKSPNTQQVLFFFKKSRLFDETRCKLKLLYKTIVWQKKIWYIAIN